MHTTIYCIVGLSGSGKDTFARFLSEASNIPVIVSYTTRPIREGEVDGIDHHFVHDSPSPDTPIMAHCKYGGYDYWTYRNQFIYCRKAIYIVDETSLKSMLFLSQELKVFNEKKIKKGLNPKWSFDVKSIHIRRNVITVPYSRTVRDRNRNISLNRDLNPDFTIYNNGTLSDLRTAALNFYQEYV